MRLILLSISLVACASTLPLTSGGESVRISTENEVEGCNFKGYIRAQNGTNFQSYESNIARSLNQARNETYSLGATHIVLDEGQPGVGTSWARQMDGTASNEAVVSGRAFDCD